MADTTTNGSLKLAKSDLGENALKELHTQYNSNLDKIDNELTTLGGYELLNLNEPLAVKYYPKTTYTSMTADDITDPYVLTDLPETPGTRFVYIQTIFYIYPQTGIQIAYGYNEVGMWIRHKRNGTWTSWTKIDEAITNILEALNTHKAESANKHITESGRNPQGSYIKFGDGSMVCMHRITLTYTSNATIDALWEFPNEFIEEPYLWSNSIESSSVVHRSLSVYFTSITTSSVMALISRITGTTDFVSGDTREVAVLAIGRWK